MTSAGDEQQIEQRALRGSAVASLIAAAVGVVWGWAAESQVILFDAAYALIGFALSAVGLRAAHLVAKGPTPRYPFGREALAPMVVAGSALVLLGMFGYAAFDAVGVILDGGSQTEVGAALVYSVLTTVASIAMYLWLRRNADGSDLIAAEAMQWRAAVWLGVAMTVGFGLAVLLSRAGSDELAGYVDPVLVLVVAVLILPDPVRMLRTSFRELLEGTPDESVTGPIRAAVSKLRLESGLPEPEVRIGKLGRKTYVELDFLVKPEEGWTIADEDAFRRRLMAELAEPGRLLWVNAELHSDPNWDSGQA